MLLLVVVLLLAYAAQCYVLKHGLDGVTFSMKSSTHLVSPEEEFQVITTLENQKKFMPVLLQIQERMPRDITIAGQVYNQGKFYSNVRYHSYTQYLRRRGRVTRTFHATLPRRGRYFFHGAKLRANDFLGIQSSQMDVEFEVEMVVAPQAIASPLLEETLGGFLGDVSVLRYIMEDPILTMGFREYTGREPLRSIAWSQSAKGHGLMVKQYDYTTQPAITVILGIDDGSPQQLENCFSITRTICQHLEEKRIRYDFLTNANVGGAMDIWTSVSEGLGTQHFNKILEGLGRATYDQLEPLSTTFKRASKRVGNSSYILIVPQENERIKEHIHHFTAIKGDAVRVITPQEVLP